MDAGLLVEFGFFYLYHVEKKRKKKTVQLLQHRTARNRKGDSLKKINCTYGCACAAAMFTRVVKVPLQFPRALSVCVGGGPSLT